MNLKRNTSNQIYFINQIKGILKNYKKYFPEHSFYLGGSLAKKEAKIVFKKGGLKPFNDIDILIINNSYNKEIGKKNKYISLIKKELKDIFLLPFVDINYTDLKYLEIDTLELYEFNLTGLLLFGRELRFKNGNIKKPQFTQFIDYLYNRIGGIILAKIGFIKNKQEVIYQYVKTWISIGDSAVYLENDYYPPYYYERMNNFIQTKIFSESIKNNCINSYKYKINLGIKNYDHSKFINNKLILKSILYLLKRFLITSKSQNLSILLANNKDIKLLIKFLIFIGIFIVLTNNKINILLEQKYFKIINNLIKKCILLSINKWLTSIGHSKIEKIKLN